MSVPLELIVSELAIRNAKSAVVHFYSPHSLLFLPSHCRSARSVNISRCPVKTHVKRVKAATIRMKLGRPFATNASLDTIRYDPGFQRVCSDPPSPTPCSATVFHVPQVASAEPPRLPPAIFVSRVHTPQLKLQARALMWVSHVPRTVLPLLLL